MAEIAELLARWDSGDGKPYKGNLIDWRAYEADPDNIGCMCAQGQVLHLVGGMAPDAIRDTAQANADRLTADLLKISRAHAILLRNVNDKVDGAPAIVLTDPAKVIGDQWSKLLDFWWHLDQMTPADWKKFYAARAAAWDAARAAAGHACWPSMVRRSPRRRRLHEWRSGALGMTGQVVILSSATRRLQAKAVIDRAPQGAVVEIKEAKRTNAQNDLMWALISQIARAKPQGRTLSPDAWKALFMSEAGFQCQFEPSLDGKGVVPLGFKSSRLRIAEFSDVIEAIYKYAAEQGIPLSDEAA